jgi:large exoprotein involved in heme utilization and adhesion
VDITAISILGLQFQQKNTPFSDITASSQFGFSGTVTLDTLNIDPSKGLVALPINLVEPSKQIVAGCSTAGRRGDAAGRFVVLGRGGLPTSPEETMTGDRALVDLAEVNLTKVQGTSKNEISKNEATLTQRSDPTHPHPAQQAAQMPSVEGVEAQSIQIDTAGNHYLLAIDRMAIDEGTIDERTTLYRAWQPVVQCTGEVLSK